MSLQGDIADEQSGANDIPHYKNLIRLQKEYIEFLAEELSKLSVFVSNRAYETPIEIIEKGIELRSKIEQIEEVLKTQIAICNILYE